MSPVRFKIVVEKLELTETCSPYEVAPLTENQFNVGDIESAVARFTGVLNTGAVGIRMAGGKTVEKE